MLSNFQSPVVLFLPNPLSGLPAVRIVVVPTGVQLYDSQIKVTLSETLIPSKNVPPLLVVFSLIYVLYLWVFFFFSGSSYTPMFTRSAKEPKIRLDISLSNIAALLMRYNWSLTFSDGVPERGFRIRRTETARMSLARGFA